MRINYAIILAQSMASLAPQYDQVLLSQCPCILTATCVPNSTCYNRQQKVRRVRGTRSAGCSACNGQGPCQACQQPQATRKEFEAVPVFVGEPQLYETVGRGRTQRAPTYYDSYPSVQQQVPQYSVQQVVSPPINQQPVQQYSQMQPAVPQVATISEQYVRPACTSCQTAPPVQKERVYVPLKPGFFQRRKLAKAAKNAARSSCSGSSCSGCSSCSTPPRPSCPGPSCSGCSSCSTPPRPSCPGPSCSGCATCAAARPACGAPSCPGCSTCTAPRAPCSGPTCPGCATCGGVKPMYQVVQQSTYLPQQLPGSYPQYQVVQQQQQPLYELRPLSRTGSSGKLDSASAEATPAELKPSSKPISDSGSTTPAPIVDASTSTPV